MPELPEVETIRMGLIEKILRKKIKKITANFPGSIKSDLSEFKRDLAGNSFKDIKRTGKLLIFVLARGGKFMLVHLKMTGQLIFCFGEKIIAGGHSLPKPIVCLPNKHTHVQFIFFDNSHLFFNDLRKFGYIKLVTSDELRDIKETYGIEPLQENFKLEMLAEIFEKRRAPVKTILLDQKAIAGIGNIYADEILFKAGVLPDRSANTLVEKEIISIHRATKAILKKAIKFKGTTFNDYADSDGQAGNFSQHLHVYGRTDKRCLRCRTGIISKKKIAGRGTHFCPNCQH